MLVRHELGTLSTPTRALALDRLASGRRSGEPNYSAR
jgi:hypothetical protein